LNLEHRIAMHPLRSTAPCNALRAATLGSVLLLIAGCGGGKRAETSNDFFTSGSREADQRASQRMARSEQLESDDKTANGDGNPAKPGDPASQRDQEKQTLYARLGGEAGMAEIVEDFIDRALADPRINWERAGIQGGLFRNKQVTQWTDSPGNVAILKKHMNQFLSLATGGPTQYDGRNLRESHASLRITNAEFDAAVGALKASLDRVKVASREQKELLAIVESTRPLIVTQR
jgi:hemoglobin